MFRFLPKQYYYLETLVRQQKDQDYSGFVDTFGYGLSSLVTCLGETHFRKRQTRHLFQLLLKYESIGKFLHYNIFFSIVNGYK